MHEDHQRLSDDDASRDERERRRATRNVLIGGVGFLSAMVGVSVWAGVTVDEPVVVHRGLDGEATRTGSITPLLVVMPTLALFALVKLAAVTRWPLRMDASGRVAPASYYQALGIGVLAFSAVIHALIVLDAAGVWRGDPAGAIFLVSGGCVAALGVWTRRSPAIQETGAGLNLELPRDPAARARVVRRFGGWFTGVGLATMVASLLVPLMGGAVLVVGLLACVVAVVRASARERAAERTSSA